MLVVVAALAIAGEYFFDPLGSHELTHGPMKDRLVLNLSMVNNPNALGHTVVPVIPMLYYFCIWKRPLFMKEIGLVTFIIPLWCVYLTCRRAPTWRAPRQSWRRSIFGRPKAMQAIILAVAWRGVTAVQTLPRMGELQTSKTDEAIQGRSAFTYRRGLLRRPDPRGWSGATSSRPSLRDHKYYKAAHSTYVQTGTELGRDRALSLPAGDLDERSARSFRADADRRAGAVRRILFVLLLTYCVSGWMVDFAYRATFFMFTRGDRGLPSHALFAETDRSEET